MHRPPDGRPASSFPVRDPTSLSALSWESSRITGSTARRRWMFAGTVVLTLFIAVLAISYQAIRTALHNPADALRYQ